MWLATRLRSALSSAIPAFKAPAPFQEYALLTYLAVPVWLILVVVLGLSTTFEHPLRPSALVTRLLRHHVAGVVSLSAVQYFSQSVVNRSLVLCFVTASFGLMLLQRLLVGAWLSYQHARGRGGNAVLLVGKPSRRMHEFVRGAASNTLQPHVLGYIADDAEANGLSSPPPDAPPLSRLGTLDKLEQILHERGIDHVVFFAPYERPETMQRELTTCETFGVPANFVVDARQLARAAPRITELYNHCVIRFDVAPKAPDALALKHALDPILAGIAIIVLSPILLAIAIAIRATMGAPVLFVQRRSGRFGREFKMLKFRTMRAGAETERAGLLAKNEMDGPVFKLTHDPRVTPLGRFLRKFSLDELPQLLNVVSGAMSLVGPRPLPVQEQGQIRGVSRRRLSMKPGLTCLWQISGRSDIVFDDWMLLDLKYIDEWSLWLDLQILLRTVPVVVLGRGAR
jgi:exopolysaccharide biosynthesis polyprenyl glycosylphosphotransferase